eukprot:6932081-Pyramimonas_sp.AAC.1
MTTAQAETDERFARLEAQIRALQGSRDFQDCVGDAYGDGEPTGDAPRAPNVFSLKIDAIEKKLSELAAAQSAATSAAGSTATSVRSFDSDRKRARVGHNVINLVDDRDIPDRTKVWVRGFPRKLLKTRLDEQFAIMKSSLPASYRDRCQAWTRNMQTAYVVKFESEQDANSFYDQFRAAPPTWRDPRAGTIHQIR